MWFLALRHLTSRKKQTFLTLLGILLGTAAYVVISGLLIGFQEFLVDQLVDNDAHIRIKARAEVLSPQSLNAAFFGDSTIVTWLKPPAGRKDNPYVLSPGTWMRRLQQNPEVAGAAAHMELQVIANHGKVTSTAKFLGVDPDQQKTVSNIGNYMLSGKLADIGNSGNRVIVGKLLLDLLGAVNGETIYLSAGKGAPQPFRVVGVFKIGVKSVDETTVIGAIGDAQKLNQTPSRVTSIAVRLKDVRKAPSMAIAWNSLASEKVESWDQANQGLMSVFSMQDVVRNTMTISILIVAGFGIYNILSLAISHKKREIAILRSMGFEPQDISQLFLTQGLVLGGFGGIVGLLLGFLVCLYMSSLDVSSHGGITGDGMFISFNSMIYLKGFFWAMLSACVASILPARAAGKLEPIDILRSENE